MSTISLSRPFRAFYAQLAAANVNRTPPNMLSQTNKVTAQQEITFTRRERRSRRLTLDESWYAGDLEFTFRTAQDEAVLLHQVNAEWHEAGQQHNSTFSEPLNVAERSVRDLRADLPQGSVKRRYFKISLRGANEIEFAYTLASGQARTTRLVTSHKMNTGEWQQVRVDTDGKHLRFSVNLVDFMIDLKENEHFTHFNGPLVIGAAMPGEPSLDQEVEQGFVGCFRGLAINGQSIDLHSYVLK